MDQDTKKSFLQRQLTQWGVVLVVSVAGFYASEAIVPRAVETLIPGKLASSLLSAVFIAGIKIGLPVVVALASVRLAWNIHHVHQENKESVVRKTLGGLGVRLKPDTFLDPQLRNVLWSRIQQFDKLGKSIPYEEVAEYLPFDSLREAIEKVDEFKGKDIDPLQFTYDQAITLLNERNYSSSYSSSSALRNISRRVFSKYVSKRSSIADQRRPQATKNRKFFIDNVRKVLALQISEETLDGQREEDRRVASKEDGSASYLNGSPTRKSGNNGGSGELNVSLPRSLGKGDVPGRGAGPSQ